MVNGEIYRLIELLGPGAKNDPKVKALLMALQLNPKMADTVLNLLRAIARQAGVDLSDPASFPIIRSLPEGGTHIGTVINGTVDGPTFYVPEGTAADLENIGLFGLPRGGKTFILMAIVRHSMLNGNVCWMFDVEDELSRLVDAIPEPYKPVIITPEHLRINLFQPPSDRISLRIWLQTIALLLRGEVYIRNGGQNLFQDSLGWLLKSKDSFHGSGRYPSLAETLRYFQGLKLSGSEVRGKAWLESLVNRMKMLVNTYEPTSHVTSSNMLELLANKSVIFRLHDLRGIPLHFLTNFLLTWLAGYKQGATDAKKLHTLGLDEQHLFRVDKGRNDIGSATLESLFATGPKRGLRTAIANQLISMLDEEIFGNISCRIITRLANPRDIRLIQQSMGLSLEQAKSITRLEKREVIVSYGGSPTPFKVRVDQFEFPPMPDEMYLEKIAQAFLDQVTWSEDSGLEGGPVEPEAVTGDALKVFMRIAKVAEIITKRCKAIDMDRASELRARRVLEAKGYIAEEEITLGNKKKIHKVTPKGAAWAKKMGIKVKHHKGGALHEYLLDHVEKNIGLLNPRFKFQRHSDIAREHRLQPDSVLLQPQGLRRIIEICCNNLDYEAKNLVKERKVKGVDMVIAIAPNRRVKNALQRALERCQNSDAESTGLAPLVLLDAGVCLSPSFDWLSVFERP